MAQQRAQGQYPKPQVQVGPTPPSQAPAGFQAPQIPVAPQYVQALAQQMPTNQLPSQGALSGLYPQGGQQAVAQATNIPVIPGFAAQSLPDLLRNQGQQSPELARLARSTPNRISQNNPWM